MDWGSREEIAYATSLSFNFFRENEEGGGQKAHKFSTSTLCGHKNTD